MNKICECPELKLFWNNEICVQCGTSVYDLLKEGYTEKQIAACCVDNIHGWYCHIDCLKDSI